MDLQSMTEKQRSALRKKCLRSLFSFCIAVMGYDDIVEDLHGDYCAFLQGKEKRKQATMPRSFVKTWIGSIAYPIWMALPRKGEDEFPFYKAWEDKLWTLGVNLRILVASYVITNSEKMLNLIKRTYESNIAMQILFPEVIPYNFRKTRWSNQSLCINRTMEATESTFEACGIGGSSTSRHYDLILEDDLIYANKDDLSGQELQPNQEDIDKAIGWHKLCSSLLVPGKHTQIHNTGTRWAKKDLVAYIWENEPDYKIFRRACVKLPDEVISGESDMGEINFKDFEPEWKEAYDHAQLQGIRNSQGAYMFATQYLLLPSSPEQTLFKPHWLQFYNHLGEVPKEMNAYTIVDLSEWVDDSKRKKGLCNSVVLTGGFCTQHQMWILHYDYGRFNPSQIIMLMAKHWKLFSPKFVAVESVYYQKSIAHFAREYMTEGRIPYINIKQIHPEGNKSKDLRIHGLEPRASNLAIHCSRDHKELVTEWKEYSKDNKLCGKDILDTMAYLNDLGSSPESSTPKRGIISSGDMPIQTAEELLKGFWNRGKRVDLFGNPTVGANAFAESSTPQSLEEDFWSQVYDLQYNMQSTLEEEEIQW